MGLSVYGEHKDVKEATTVVLEEIAEETDKEVEAVEDKA